MQTNNIITPWDSINVQHEWYAENANTYIEVKSTQNYMDAIDAHIGDVIVFLTVYICFMAGVALFKNENKNKKNKNGDN